MKEKTKKLLYEYTTHSRITTKELGKKINSSQQSASYMLNSIKDKKLIFNDTCIIDAVKLGFINSLIGFNYIKLNNQTRKEIIEKLRETNEVIAIEESKEGFDLLVEFSTKNLASLDKIHTEFIHEFDKRLKTAFILPIITKYKHPKKHLRSVKVQKSKVLFGDRNTKKLSTKEILVLQELVKDPTQKLIEIADKTNINVKNVIKIKKELERKFIIKGYSATLNHSELGINREIIFLRFSSEGLKEIDDFIEFSKSHKNIVATIKTIGSSQVVIVAESLNEIELIREIRSKFSIENYMVFRSADTHKKQYIPTNFE